MVVVEGRRLHGWNSKQVGHLAKVCPQIAPKEADTTQPPKLTEGDVTKATPEKENPPSTEDGGEEKATLPKKPRTH